MKKARQNDIVVLQKKDFAKICRCCLAMGPTTSIFRLQYEDTSFSEILQCLFCSEIKVDDELPKNICKKCISKVVWYYCFKRSYDMAEATLLTILEKSEKEKQASEIKLEITVDENCLKDRGEDTEIHIYQSINDFENNVQEEHKEGDVIKSISVDDCKDAELKVKPLSETKIGSKPTCEENLTNSVNSSYLLQENQILDIQSDETGDKEKLNDPLNFNNSQENLSLDNRNLETDEETLNNPAQQDHIVDVPNPETVVKKPDSKKNTNKDEQSPKMITCGCSEVFATQSEYQMHRKKQAEQHRHKYRHKYPCEICKKSFTRAHLLHHMRSHTNEKPFKCELCFLSFSVRNNLRRHKRIHTGEKPYVCEHCGKAFAQSTTLVNHRRIHTNEKPFLCASCGERFGNTSHFNLHKKKHKKNTDLQGNKGNEEPFSCEICSIVFENRSQLGVHLQKHKHKMLQHKNNEKKFLCTYCGKGFTNNGALQIHTSIHTGEKRYSCTYCDKKFRQGIALKVHVYTHTGEKPYVCQICHKAFVQIQHLKSHLRTHNGEKPYKCKLCGKAFAHQTTHIVHMRRHTGERPFVCDGCQKGFYHSSSMKKHREKCCKGVQEKNI